MVQESPNDGAMAGQVKGCRLQSARAGGKVLIWIVANSAGVEDIAAAASVQLGGIHEHGAPPKSHVARRFQLHLDGLRA